MTAATQVPMSCPAIANRIWRSAPNRKPRKKNSSAIGAITHTNTAAATSAAVLCVAPSSLGSLSVPWSANTVL